MLVPVRLLSAEVSFVYKVARDDELYWMAQNARQHKLADSMTMTLTCVQKVYSVLNHKVRYEKLNGEIGAPDNISLTTMTITRALSSLLG